MIVSLFKAIFSVGAVVFFGIFCASSLFAASDSEASSSDERDMVLPVHAPRARLGLQQRESGSSPEHPPELVVSPSRDSRRSPLANSRSGSRIRDAMAQVVPRLDFATVTPEDYDDARALAEEFIAKVGGDCPTDRSSRIVSTLQKNVEEDTERRKKSTLADSIAQGSEITDSDERELSIGREPSPGDRSEREMLLKIIRRQEIAHHMLAQAAVRAEDNAQWARHEAEINGKLNVWSLGCGGAFGIIGLLSGFIPFCLPSTGC